MKYKDMDNTQLAQEIVRVRNLLYSNYNSHAYHQNKKYLSKLKSEWNKRKCIKK